MDDFKIQACQARVRSNKEDAKNIFRLDLEGCKMGIAKPGQFVCLAPRSILLLWHDLLVFFSTICLQVF